MTGACAAAILLATVPAAADAPCTRAMTGCGSALIDCIIRLHCANSFSIFGCSFSARRSTRRRGWRARRERATWICPAAPSSPASSTATII